MTRMMNRGGHRHYRSHTKAVRRFRVVRHDRRAADIYYYIADAFCLPSKQGEMKLTYLCV